MAFWWPLIILALYYGLYRFLLMLILLNVASVDVDVSGGNILS
ncbi:hypothetical protein LINPERHAP2_LOCUS24496 [Linum perenne]